MSNQQLAKSNMVLNALLFQGAWICLVVNIFDGYLGWLFILLLFLHRLLIDTLSMTESVFIICIVFAGSLSDAILFDKSIYTVKEDPSGILPLWLLGLWLGFASTLRVSLKWLLNYPVIFVIAISVLGPMSYRLGEELGAIEISNHAHLLINGQWFGLSIFILVLDYIASRFGLNR